MTDTKKISDQHPKLKPYAFHGLKFEVKGLNAYAQCMFCTREGKFSVQLDTGKYRCVVCNQSGNHYGFLRLLWEKSLSVPTDYEPLRLHRNLLYTSTLGTWGVRKSCINGNWIIPGYGADGKLNTLYRYVKTKEGWKVLATPELNHQLFGVHMVDEKCKRIYVCEGPWDAMALWETMLGARSVKVNDEESSLVYTKDRKRSVLKECAVIAVPSCSVYNPKWNVLFEGKEVIILFDNDYPKQHPNTDEVIPPAGYEGTKRLALTLSACIEHKPKSVSILWWGPEGYDPDLPSGCDVRDILGKGNNHPDRVKELDSLLKCVNPMPEQWVLGRSEEARQEGSTGIESLPCESWAELIPAWRMAMKWIPGLNRALACGFAAIASTMIQGDQLWIKMISSPSGGKSTLCEAWSVCEEFVTAKSTIRGFHSGYKSDSDGKEDNSLIPLIKGKTLVTKDGDTLLTSPNLDQILSEGRDLYDSTARTHYRNRTARDYKGVRFTWILCGTSALRLIDRSELGQRFLDVVIMEDIDEEMEDEILERKIHETLRSSRYEANGKAESHYNPDLLRAMQLTGGYVKYLRTNILKLIENIEVEEQYRYRVKSYAKFVAYMRARPSTKQDEGSGREMAGRLLSQLGRLMLHLAVVLNKPKVDDEVMEMVRGVTLDTARGKTLEMCRHLYKAGEEGCELRSLAELNNESMERTQKLVKFLVGIKAIDPFIYKPVPTLGGQVKYRLSQRVKTLYEEANEQW